VKHADFRGASLLGADLSGLENAGKADFAGAYYDDLTIFDPAVDTGGLVFLPEPEANLLLLVGVGAMMACPRCRRAARARRPEARRGRAPAGARPRPAEPGRI
jgi:hypothetical protein